MILAIDEGTTGITVLLLDNNGQIKGRAYCEISQHFPKAGWVEHDGMEIWQSSLRLMRRVLAQAGVNASALRGIGITNQRETTLLWDRATGAPVAPAIVWQCRRSAPQCEAISAAGHGQWIREKTGLVVDAYFSATKLMWLFEQQPQLRVRAQRGELCFGTMDSWLMWQLSGGHAHVTDHSNASRTLLYNLHTRQWDPELLDCFDIPATILPDILPSAGEFTHCADDIFDGVPVPITGVAGDQQAALFGQGCTEAGMLKNTYGTGCFMLMYTGQDAVMSANGLLTTMACAADGSPAYALEGAVFMGGAAVQWLRDEMGLIGSAQESEAIAMSIEDTQGVYLVPAFTGLGAPWWDMQARGCISGLTRGVGRAEIVRATLEAIAYQSCDLAVAMASDAGTAVKSLRVDGGACANGFLMQFQADMLDAVVQRPQQVETTALGAAMLAGIGCGLWQAENLPSPLRAVEKEFKPSMESPRRQQLHEGWQRAVRQVLQAAH